MVNDALDQKFGNRNKNRFQNATTDEFVWHFMVLSRQLVLKAVAFCLDTCKKASVPLPNCSIDNALVQFFPCRFDTLVHLINVFNL